MSAPVAHRVIVLGVLVVLGGAADRGLAGAYRDSAHGSAGYGADRQLIDPKFAEYATGNCAHCHEQHASVDGSEPEPRNGASAHAVFANGFDPARTLNPYTEADAFCFFCHGGLGPRVVNRDYSAVFGGALAGGAQSILEAFNQTSYHNLYDVWSFMKGKPSVYPWFGNAGNPCSACHNSHLAKRNHDPAKTGFPMLSAISLPGDRSRLWGESEAMFPYTSYEAPFFNAIGREPGGVGDADGRKTPDYVGFCGSCHNPQNTIYSTTLNRNLKAVNWTTTGTLPRPDKHGVTVRLGAGHFRPPYSAAASLKSNFVLSCADCHEPHGSPNVVLLRRRVNGEDLEFPVATVDSLGAVCKRCHTDDLAAAGGTGQANRWQFVHHTAAASPYGGMTSNCSACHPSADGQTPIPCGNCHGHGMDDSWAPVGKTGQGTF